MSYCVRVFPGEPLQAVIDGLPMDGQHAEIRLSAGTWKEKVELCRPNTTLIGAGMGQTVITFGQAAADPMPDYGNRGTFRTATLRTDGERITLRGLTIANSAWPLEKSGQALALYADGDGFVCEDCELLGHQDTLFTAPLPPKEVQKNGFVGPKQFAPRVFQRHVYRRCVIRGDVDFIFGGAAAWFEHCDIISDDGREDRSQPRTGFITAASTPEGQGYGYVFNECRFRLAEGTGGTYYLGRPWREFAQTVLIRCELGAHIRPEGWHDWEKPQFPQTGFYAEYGCYGPGAQGERVPYAHHLTDEEARRYTLEAFLACDH